MTGTRKGPLAGLRVLDLSQVIAGPYGAALLADSGAEVIKIETLSGEMARSLGPLFLAMNRGKQSLPINLQTEDGREVFYRLVKTADVLMENFRPGVTQRLKIDYETLKQLNPRLVYVSVTAFGPGGPYVHRPGFDPLLQAMSGLERAQGGPHNPPVFLRVAITDYATAMTQAAAVTMALYKREQTGRGEHIETSLLRNGIFINAGAFTRYEGRPEPPSTDAGQNGLGPLDRMYPTSDGRWLFIVAHDHFEALAAVTGLAGDPRFASAEARQANAAALAEALQTAFATGEQEAWLAQLEAADVPAAPVVVDYQQRFFEEVDAIAAGYVVSAEHPVRGYLEQTGNFIRFSRSETSRETTATPQLGADTDAILSQLGYDAESIERLKAAGVVS